MTTKQLTETFDKIAYYGLCLLSLGVAYFIRVIVSESIRQARQ